MSLLKKKNKTVGTNVNERKAETVRFISDDLKDEIESATFIEVNMNFLGSCHTAAKHPGAGTQYGNYKHIYYHFSLNGETCILNFTFSGPTMLDVKKPTIKSITKEAQTVLSDLVLNIGLLKKAVVINIQGHSRGGVIADIIHKWIPKANFGSGVNLGKLSIADPYAGPVNRLVHKKMGNFDENESPETLDINATNGKVSVYSVVEKRFRTPAQFLKRVGKSVFTDVPHDRTKYIALYMFRYLHQYNEKIYIFADKRDIVKNDAKKDIDKVNKELKENITSVDSSNIEKILQGESPYENFAYRKISSDGRRVLFYVGMGMVDKTKTLDFLKKGKHMSIYRKVSAVLK